jgi:heterodisulfide reductase subunit B2
MSDEQVSQEAMHINGDLARLIQAEIGQNVYLCYQCVKCTSGCPVGEYFDWQPNQILRALQLGQSDIALHAETPWLCASCQACTTRCPQSLDIAGIMDFLTREAVSQGIKPKIPEVKIFNEAFMRHVRLWGRSYELGLMAELKLRTKNIFGDMDLGVKMISKGKFPFLPKPAHHKAKATPVPGASEKIAYYPGCSLHSTAKEFDESARAVCEALAIPIQEPEGWMCCGSSAAHRADPKAAVELPMLNMALIEQSGYSEVTMPCAACYNRHQAALFEIRRDESHRAAFDRQIDYEYQDRVKVTSLAESVLNYSGEDKIRQHVQKPLAGLSAVCYYGCLLTRPPQVTGAEHPENPVFMDKAMSALGLNVLDWSYKTTCCGAAHSLTRPDIVHDLSSRLIKAARETGADLIVVACPLCHTNLDARQFQMGLEEPMPILYFTQVMALAFGLPKQASALKMNLVDPRPLLASKGLEG